MAAGEFKIWGGTMNVPYIKESLGQGLSSYVLDVKIETHLGPMIKCIVTSDMIIIRD